jgi:hypothetical protein
MKDNRPHYIIRNDWLNIANRLEYLRDRWEDEKGHEEFHTFEESLRGLIESTSPAMEFVELSERGGVMKAVINHDGLTHTITCDDNDIVHKHIKGGK